MGPQLLQHGLHYDSGYWLSDQTRCNQRSPLRAHLYYGITGKHVPKGVRWASYHHFHYREGVKPRGVGGIRYLKLVPFSERACSAQSSKVTEGPMANKKKITQSS